MEYESSENTIEYQKACENVKQIANIIKSIRIKYYPNFAKVSEEDKEKYDKLNEQMKSIVTQNGLDKLGKALMDEIESKYNGNIPEIDDNKMQNTELRNQIFNELLLACYGAIDSGKQALSVGKLKTAKKCQEQLRKYTEIFEKYDDGKQFQKMVIEYQRGKFAELAETRENTKINNDKFEEIFKGYFEQTTPQQREQTEQIIAEEKVQEKTEEKVETQEEVSIG